MDNMPYPGLRPFRPDECHIYFGREQQTDQLLECLQDNRFLAVVGPSGCGKSSLINTGLIASLQMGMLASKGAYWRIARMQPRGQPMANLAAALIEGGVIEADQPPDNGPEDDPALQRWVQHSLECGPLGLDDILARHPQPEGSNLLVVVDQFEEIFRYRRISDPNEADAFIALLLHSAAQVKFPVHVIITMRSDFIGDCTVFSGLPEAINAGLFLTPKLTREEIKDAIEGPACVFGGEVEPALVNRLLNAQSVSDEPLPVLQHALMRMWTRALTQLDKQAPAEEANESPPLTLTLAQYTAPEMGGLRNALSNHADEAFQELDTPGKNLAQIIFCSLTERVTGRGDVRRPVTIGEIAMVAGSRGNWRAIAEVADHFRQTDRCFIVPSVDQQPSLTPHTELDISHESLIRLWQRLANWVEIEGQAAVRYHRIEDRAMVWSRGEGDLLGERELRQYDHWRSNFQLTRAWASRYGQHYDKTMKFLELSDEAQRQRVEEGKERVRSEQQRAIEKAEAQVAIEKQRRITWLTRFGWAVTLFLLTWVGYFFNDARSQARQARLSQLYELSERLASQARAANDMRLSLHMTMAAAHFHKQSATEFSTRNAADTAPAVKQAGLLLRRLQQAQYLNSVFEKPGGLERMHAVAFAGDGKLAFAGKGKKSSRESSGLVLHGVQGNKRLKGHQDRVSSLYFDAPRKLLISGSWDGSIRFWDENGSEQLDLEVTLPEGCEVQSVYPVSEISRPGAVFFTVNKCDGKPGSFLFAATGKIGEPRKFNINDAIKVGATQVRSMVPLGENRLALGTEDGTVILWNNTTKSQEGEWVVDPNSNQPVSVLAVDPQGKRLAYSLEPDEPVLRDAGSAITLLDISDPTSIRHLARLEQHTDSVLALAFNSSGDVLASGGRDARLLLWDLKTLLAETAQDQAPARTIRSATRHLRGHDNWIRSVVFGNDGKRLLSGDGAGRAVLWTLGDEQPLIPKMSGHNSDVYSLAFFGGGELMSGGKMGVIKLYTELSEDEVDTEPPSASTAGAVVSMAGSSAATGLTLTAHTPLSGGRSKLLGWRVERGRLRHENRRDLELPDANPVLGIALSPDGKTVAVSSVSSPGFQRFLGTLKFFRWSLDEWQELPLPEGLPESTGWGDHLAFDPKGERLAYAAIEEDGNVRKHFVQVLALDSSGRITKDSRAEGATGQLFGVAFADNRLAAGGDGNEVLLWQAAVAGWREPRRIAGHKNRIFSVSFSPDGGTLASGSRDRTVRLWDVESASQIGSFKGAQWVSKVLFSPEGKRLAAASLAGAVTLYNVDFPDYLRIACNIVGDHVFDNADFAEVDLKPEEVAAINAQCSGNNTL